MPDPGRATRGALGRWRTRSSPCRSPPAALHAGGELALALPHVGAYGYAAALAAPALALFAWKRKGPLDWRTLSTHRGRPLLGSPAGGRFRV